MNLLFIKKIRILILFSALLAVDTLSAQNVHMTVCRGNMSRLDSLFNKSVDIDTTDNRGRSLLHYAIGCRQKEAFNYLIRKGANVNALDNKNHTPLFAAVQTNNADLLSELIGHKANVNISDIYGSSPIHFAVLNNNIAIARILVKGGINLDAVNNKGTTALEIAFREGTEEIYQFLFDNGADPEKVRTHQLEGEFLGQTKPNNVPKMFAPNFVSTENWNINAVFHPNGKEFYFTIESRNYNSGTIMVSKLEENVWSKPIPADIPGDYKEVDPFITKDGTKLYYSTNRPINENDSLKKDVDIWVLNRQGNKWGFPVHLGTKVNTNESEWFPTVSDNGTLFFSREESSNIYQSIYENGVFQEGISLGDSVNSEHYDYDPYISADESYLIFSSGRPGGFGKTDLYICFKKDDGSWGQAKNMGDGINSSTSDFTPGLSPDGDYFFFSSAKDGVSDLYWVDSQIIEKLR